MPARFTEILTDLKHRHLLRELHCIDEVSGPEVVVQEASDREGPPKKILRLINFSSNNYLGLADHPRLKAAAAAATQKFGTGAGASRLITGTLSLHAELEKEIASFKGSEAAIVFNSGYQANTTLIPALAGEGDIIFSDALNHASIIDGCRLSYAQTRVFPHGDVEALRELLKREQKTRGELAEFFIVTDGVFSMDGDVAPIHDLLKLAREFNAHVVIDEAHSTGVLGATGRGLLEHAAITDGRDRIIRMGTFSKALGSFGAYVAGSRDLVQYLVNRARGFIYSTALPPAVIAASLEALHVVSDEPERLQKLNDNTSLLRRGLESLRAQGKNIRLTDSISPILPIILGDEMAALALSEKLFAAGFWCHAIRPPTVPTGTSRIRLTVTAGHTPGQIEGLLQCLARSLSE